MISFMFFSTLKSLDLKAWVDQQAIPSVGNLSECARHLVKRMPASFWTSLTDPERVIREHLRAKAKLRQASQP